jgi:hypothetical protein
MATITIPNVSVEYNSSKRTFNRWEKSWPSLGVTLVSHEHAAISGQSDEYDLVLSGTKEALKNKVTKLLKSWYYEDDMIEEILSSIKE